MIKCHNTKELLYKRHFENLDLEVLQELLKQYKWEQDNELEGNRLVIDCLEQTIEDKKLKNWRG